MRSAMKKSEYREKNISTPDVGDVGEIGVPGPTCVAGRVIIMSKSLSSEKNMLSLY